MGFMQLGGLNTSEPENAVVMQDYNFSTFTEEAISHEPKAEVKKGHSGEKIKYQPNEYNLICGKYSEYFTSELAKHYVIFGGSDIDDSHFEIDAEADWKEVSLAECMVCGGRGFFGLQCQKCNRGLYNVGIGFCTECTSTGVLGTNCSYCHKGEYKYLPIKCLNSCKGTMYKSGDKATDEIWYNDVQRSFKKVEQEKNLCLRRRAVKESRKNSLLNRVGTFPSTVLPESDIVQDSTEAHDLIQQSILELEWGAELHDDELFEKLHECHKENQIEMNIDEIPDISLDEMDRMDEELFGAIEKVDIDEIMQKRKRSKADSELLRKMQELDCDVSTGGKNDPDFALSRIILVKKIWT